MKCNILDSQPRQQQAPSVGRVLLMLQSVASGGMESYCLALTEEYVGRGLAVLVVVPETAAFDDLAAHFVAAGARVERLDTDARSGRAAQVRRWLRLMRLYRRFRPHAVHLHTGGATGGFAVIASARMFTRAAVVFTEHDIPAPHPRRSQVLMRRLMDRLAHASIACSRKNAIVRRQRLGFDPPPDKLAAVPIGIPLREASLDERLANRERIRAQFGLPSDLLVVGCVVRLANGKGLDNLLRAFALVRRQTPCALLLVGDGPLREELTSLADELGVERDVHFAGFQDDPAPFTDAMDIFALAVPVGAGSIALMEAMSRGVPSIITFGGPEEAVVHERTGLYAPPGDPEALAEALRRLAEDARLRARLGATGAAYIRERFTVSRVADDLLELYAAARYGKVPPRLQAVTPPTPASIEQLMIAR